MLNGQPLEDDPCPGGEQMFARLYAASQHGLAELVATVGVESRARLAIYCYRRAHLQDMGLAIAATCDRDAFDDAGVLGEALFLRSRERPAGDLPTNNKRRNVTLATASDHSFPPLDDDEPA
jgi:hypothetical protein